MTEENKEPTNKIETIEFDGNKYAVDDLTPRVIDGFNMLIKLQNDIAEQSYQLKKSQAAQVGLSSELKANITEDKIKPAPEVIVPEAKGEDG